MQFLVNVDLAKNQLLNAALQNLASDPSSPVAGQVYFNSTSDKIKYYNGTTFLTLLDSSVASVTSVTASSPLASSGGTTPNISLASAVSASLGGTGLVNPTAHGVLVGEGASNVNPIVLGAGQVLIGTSLADPVAATLTGTLNRLSVASASGTITLNLDPTQWPNAAAASTVLVSNGTNSAAWGTVPVSAGGTGKTSWTSYTLLYGNGVAAPVEIGPLSNGQIIVGSTGAAPVAAALTGTANRLGITNASGSITLNVDAIQWPSALAGDAGHALIASGANSASYGVLSVSGGGTGATTLTGLLRGNGAAAISGSAQASLTSEVTGILPVGNGGTGQSTLTVHGVLIGNATSAISMTGAGTSGQVLVSSGALADPAFQSAGGDISGLYTNIVVGSVNLAAYPSNTAANIASAVSLKHAQNTDTGTTAISFLIDSSGTGVRIKDESGLLSVRNAADTSDANVRMQDLTCRNLTISGLFTSSYSTTVTVGDSTIDLNDAITAAAQNADASYSVARLNSAVTISGAANNGVGLIRITAAGHGLTTGDYTRINSVVGTVEANSSTTNPAWRVTVIDASNFDLVGSAFVNAWVSGGTSNQRIDAKMYWSESSKQWKTYVGSDSSPVVFGVARTISFNIGDGLSLSYILTHNLNTRLLNVQVSQAGSPYNIVVADIAMTTVNTLTVSFASAPAAGAYNVTIIG